MIERLPPLPVIGSREHEDAPALQVDFPDLMKDPCVDPVVRAELLGGYRYERIEIVDNLADVIGDASGRVGCVRTPFKGDDLQVLFEPLRLCSSTHPRCIAPDDHESFLCHGP